ncbi:hypothetical protein Poly59_11100 [Rubripirellula reticaptiva]|uniref:Uncharacterized protein n=1 Tax=Rubripirellula reticaptiva TaxID=2528013 RepID=A0A5C6FC58_9BACT|nr:hypothetical protein Poly59_11100 [Rubripirellula reticaptiva]
MQEYHQSRRPSVLADRPSFAQVVTPQNSLSQPYRREFPVDRDGDRAVIGVRQGGASAR